MPVLRSKETISDDEWEYKPAVLDETIQPLKVQYGEKSFLYNFQDSGVFVAKDFEDIKDFISLWSYLKHEALVLEVGKLIEEDDISVFFQLKSAASQKNKKIVWKLSIDEGVKSEFSSLIPRIGHGILNQAPVIQIATYLESVWMINEDHQLMCKEFIGRKILPNSHLKIYLRNKFRTTNEIAQHHSLTVARIALGISFIAILLGNILPLFQPKEVDYLKKINTSLTEISEKITVAQLTTDTNNYNEIKDKLDDIMIRLDTMQSNGKTE